MDHAKRICSIAALFAAAALSGCIGDSDVDRRIDNAGFLLDLPSNRWVTYQEIPASEWWRRSHAGLAYDSTRGSLLVFGSDTHGEDWDNVVHEFVVGDREWVHHGKISPPETYRVDDDGRRVAGRDEIAPWAMHTYDGVAYDSVLDALIVTASPDHSSVKVPKERQTTHPFWRYSLQTRKWSVLHPGLGEDSQLFGAATAYDGATGRLFICKNGLWSLDTTNQRLERLAKAPNCLHRNMVFDTVRRQLYLFGAYRPSNRIWRWDVSTFSTQAREWEVLDPTGDLCPPYTKAPVAFAEDAGVFLLVVDPAAKGPERSMQQARTFIYDPAENRYEELEGASLPRVGMNFMLAWDKVYKAFFLVTGDWERGAKVWTLRLDPPRRTPSSPSANTAFR